MFCNKDIIKVVFGLALVFGSFSAYGTAAKPQIVILANSIDWALAADFVNHLESKGFEVVHSTYPYFENYKNGKRIIILGGPDAPEMVGTVVNQLLTEEEKLFLRSGSGNKKQYVLANVWAQGQTVRIIAGNGRDDTKKHSDQVKDEVVTEKTEEIAKTESASTSCNSSKSNKLSVAQFRLFNIAERIDTPTKITVKNNSEFKLFLLLYKPEETLIKDLKIELLPSSGVQILSDNESLSEKEKAPSAEDSLGDYIQGIGIYRIYTLKAVEDGTQPIGLKVTYNADGNSQVLCQSRGLNVVESPHKLKIKLLNITGNAPSELLLQYNKMTDRPPEVVKQTAQLQITYDNEPAIENMPVTIYIYNELFPYYTIYTNDLDFRLPLMDQFFSIRRDGSLINLTYAPSVAGDTTQTQSLCNYRSYLEFEVTYKNLVSSVAKTVSVKNCK